MIVNLNYRKFQLCDAYKKYFKYRDMGSESQDKKIQHTNSNQKNAGVIILTWQSRL